MAEYTDKNFWLTIVDGSPVTTEDIIFTTEDTILYKNALPLKISFYVIKDIIFTTGNKILY